MFRHGQLAGHAALPLAIAVAAMTTGVTTLGAQMNENPDFDGDRAFIADSTIFVPFRVTDDDVVALRRALDDGAVQPDTWLVIMEHDAGRLALVMDQMAYHHVAQGDLMGEPWMVSF